MVMFFCRPPLIKSVHAALPRTNREGLTVESHQPGASGERCASDVAFWFIFHVFFMYLNFGRSVLKKSKIKNVRIFFTSAAYMHIFITDPKTDLNKEVFCDFSRVRTVITFDPPIRWWRSIAQNDALTELIILRYWTPPTDRRIKSYECANTKNFSLMDSLFESVMWRYIFF